MGLFSKFSKNKQETAGQDSGFYSKADDQAVLERAKAKRATSADGPAGRRTRISREGDDPVLPEKKRARRRLVGAIALALGVAIGLPMLLDSEPKQAGDNIAWQIPSKDKAPEAAPAPAAPVSAADSLDAREEIVADAAPAKPATRPQPAAPAPAHAALPPAALPPAVTTPALPVAAMPAVTVPTAAPSHAAAPAPVKDLAKEAAIAAAKAAADKTAADKAAAEKAAADKLAKLEHKAQDAKEAKERADAKLKAEQDVKLAKAKAELEAKAEAKAKADEVKHARAEEAKHPKSDDAARAMAILEDKPADNTRYVVQVAAVASQEKVDELQGKLKEAGIKSFTQKVTTASGTVVTRIRVGPFSGKEEAEKVRAKLSKIGLSSSLATS